MNQARAALLWGGGLFLAALAFTNLLIDHLDAGIRDPEFDLKISRLRELVKQESARPLLLVLGSSRVASGVDPDEVKWTTPTQGLQPLVFNAGLTGGGPMAEYLCLRRILAAGIKPAYVVVEVFPGILARGEQELTIAKYVERLDLDELSALDKYWTAPLARRLEWANVRLTVLSAMRFGLQYRYAPSWATQQAAGNVSWMSWQKQTAKGFMTPRPKLSPDERAKLEKKGRDAYSNWLANFSVADASDCALRDLLQTCRTENIGVALVWLPEAGKFQGLYGPTAASVADTYFHRVEHELGVPFVSARDWIADDGFLDGHHLSAAGARAFTRRLTTDVIEPLVRFSSVRTASARER
jgi:hypothetical protein